MLEEDAVKRPSAAQIIDTLDAFQLNLSPSKSYVDSESGILKTPKN